MKKKVIPRAQAGVAPAPPAVSVSVSSSPAAPYAEAETRWKAPYVAPVYPSTPSRKEKREYSHAKLKGVPIWVNETLWIKQRKANHERNYSPSGSSLFSMPPQDTTLSPPRRQLSPTVRPFTSRAEIPPPPKLQPLLFTNAQSSPLDSTDKDAAHAAWWARISNDLASHSARSYHLFVASSFLTCKTEELLLLYEVQKLNADGKMLFEEILRGLRVRASNWEGSIDELRISWDMTSKLEMVGRYDVFVAEQVARLEREVRGDASGCDDDVGDDAETVVNDRAWQGDCSIEYSSPENSPIETSRPSETNASGEGSEKSFTIWTEKRKDCGFADSPTDVSLPDNSPFSWADDANEAHRDDHQIPIDRAKKQGESAVLKSGSMETLADAAIPSPIDISPPTWAKVVASPVNIQTRCSAPEKNCDAASSKDWGDVSGEAWAWERNWR